MFHRWTDAETADLPIGWPAFKQRHPHLTRSQYHGKIQQEKRASGYDPPPRPEPSEPPLAEQIWTLLLKNRRKDQPSIGDLADRFEVAPKTIRAALDELTSQHKAIIVNAAGYVSVPSSAVPTEREDMKYLGMYNAMVNVGPLRVTLHHGAKGAYTLSYHPQKYAESMTSKKTRPHLLVIGHYHSAIYIGPYVGIHTMTGGCWEGQSNYLKRMAIDPVIGGWFITATVIDGEVRRFLPEFSTF